MEAFIKPEPQLSAELRANVEPAKKIGEETVSKLKWIGATKVTQDRYEYGGELFAVYYQDVLKESPEQMPTPDDISGFCPAIATLKIPTGNSHASTSLTRERDC